MSYSSAESNLYNSMNPHTWFLEFFNRGSDVYTSKIQQLWSFLSIRGQSTRKAILQMARAQHIPKDPTTKLSLLTGVAQPDFFDGSHFDFRHITSSILQDFVDQPLFAGIVTNICYAAPYPHEDRKQIINDSWGKEIRILQSEALPSRFNFDVWFNPHGYANQRFHPDIPPNPFAAYHIHSILCRWRTIVCSSIQFPRMSTKSVSRDTQREVDEFLGGDGWKDRGIGECSQVRLEQIQHEYKCRFHGVCEVRQRWQRSGISPRTYFCQGGDAFNRSKFLHDPFNILVELFPPTEYHARLNPTRLFLVDQSENVIIWDLATFTSNHHEVRYFLLGLANFCSGYMIKLFDSVEGLVEVDLGILLGEYAQLSCFPEYSLERVDDYYKGLVHFHNIAGFLGVYGNLPVSTFLHGASVFQVIGQENRMNVAGDDGHAVVVPGSSEDYFVQRVIRGNGVIEDSKLFWTYEDGAICLKRGLVQIGNRILQKNLVLWPSLHLIRDVVTWDPRVHHTETKEEMKEKVAYEILRFMASISTGFRDYAQVDLEFILWFIRRVFATCGLDCEGNLPQLSGGYLCPLEPRDISDLSLDPLHVIITYHYKGVVSLPVRELIDCYTPQELSWEIGYEWYGSTTRYWSILETLGYLTSSPIHDTYFGLDGYDRLRKEFSFVYPAVRKFCIVSVPDDVYQL